jgi:hypothetical protein
MGFISLWSTEVRGCATREPEELPALFILPSSSGHPPIIIGPARIIHVKEWTDNSRCKGKGKGKCKGKCPAKNRYDIGYKYSPSEADAV